MTIDWGDGTAPSAGTITFASGVYTVQGSHTYAVGLGLPDDVGHGDLLQPARYDEADGSAGVDGSSGRWILADDVSSRHGITGLAGDGADGQFEIEARGLIDLQYDAGGDGLLETGRPAREIVFAVRGEGPHRLGKPFPGEQHLPQGLVRLGPGQRAGRNQVRSGVSHHAWV